MNVGTELHIPPSTIAAKKRRIDQIDRKVTELRAIQNWNLHAAKRIRDLLAEQARLMLEVL